MSIEYFIFKALRYLTLIGSIIFLFLKYFAFPDKVAVFFGNEGSPEGFLPKDQIFYLIVFLLLLINLLPSLLIQVISKANEYFFQKINGFFNKNIEKNSLLAIFTNWSNLSIALLNILILLAILILSRLNASEYITNLSDYNWFAPFTFSVFLILFLYPSIKIFFAKN